HRWRIQRVEHVCTRKRDCEQRFVDGGEPNSDRGLAATEENPIGRASEVKVEAVVCCRLFQASDGNWADRHRPRPKVPRNQATRMLTYAGAAPCCSISVARYSRSLLEALRLLKSCSIRVRSASRAAFLASRRGG